MGTSSHGPIVQAWSGKRVNKDLPPFFLTKYAMYMQGMRRGLPRLQAEKRPYSQGAPRGEEENTIKSSFEKKPFSNKLLDFIKKRCDSSRIYLGWSQRDAVGNLLPSKKTPLPSKYTAGAYSIVYELSSF